MNDRETRLLGRIRAWVVLFIIGLVLSGATAIPLETELNWLVKVLRIDSTTWAPWDDGFRGWVYYIWMGVRETNDHYPFLAYGTDWLAFGHFVIALAFVGAWREPVRNRWLFDFGLIACALVIPFALIFGGVRGIPIYWRLIDCSFGVFGAVPLWLCRRDARELEAMGK
ncbi:MAG: hypothetical protein HY301_17430 [Verrucomicrobia bacterium]|nr:hypothetical protein [Verrucomicrobiota bacterium]